MKLHRKCLNTTLLGAALVMISSLASDGQERSLTFSVFNKSPSKIVKVMVSPWGDPDRASWHALKIGKGIEPGDTKILKWDDQEYDQPCDERVVGYFPDGGQTKIVRANLCKADAQVSLVDAASP
jgi:hypothetical protein